MTMLATRQNPVAKTDRSSQPKRYGTLIRVSDRFAEAVRRAQGVSGASSVAEFLDQHVLAAVNAYHDAEILKRAKRIKGGQDN